MVETVAVGDPEPSWLASEVLDAVRDGYQVVSPELRYIYLNDAAVRHIRRPRSELLDRTLMDVHPGLERTTMFAVLRRCMERRVPAQMEYEHVFPDGHTCWFALDFQPIRGGMLVCSRDMTDRKRTQDELLRVRRVLRVISKANRALLWARDETDFIANVCRIAVERGGYRMAWIGNKERDDERSVRVVGVFGEDDGYTAKVPMTWDADAPSGQGPTGRSIREERTVTARFISTDPSSASWRHEAITRGYASSISLPYRVTGDVVGTLSIYSAEPNAFDDEEAEALGELALDLGHGVEALRARALSEKRAEALKRLLSELRASEDRYRNLVENLEDLVFALDANGCFQYMSPSVRRYGFEPSELQGEHYSRFVHPNDVAALAESFDRTLTGSTEPHLFRVRSKAGAERIVRSTSRVVREGGKPVGMSGVMVDMTELKRTEDQLRAAQKMEAVGQLAGGIAHDFNNLLSVIISYTGFLGGAVKDDPQAVADADEVLKAAARAASLTRQLLAFSRKQVLEPRVLSLNSVVLDLENMLRRLIGKHIQLVHALAPDLGRVLADRGQIEQVLVNLVVNARDAMPDGGTVRMATANVELDHEYARENVSIGVGSFVLITVSDTGAGMDEATRQHLFEPFYTTKEIGKGTGLGLSTVHGIVEQSGGKIWFSSEVGVGTTFKVYLPRVHDELAACAAGTAIEGIPHGDETVLLVEDDSSVRRLTERLLRSVGYEVVSAESSLAAIELCEQGQDRIDLLLTDVVMPQINGRSLAERLTRSRPDLRVLYMSGYTDDIIAQHGVLEPGVSFIAKPFSARELARKVRASLDARRRSR